jgi:hypothetical protein
MTKAIATFVVAVAMVFTVFGETTAFDVSGVRSGMSREQASAVLSKAGFRLFPNQPDPNSLAASRDGTTHVLKFCQNRLENYSHTLSGGMTTFTRQADALTRERGTGQPETLSVERGSPIDSVGLSWRKGTEYLKLSYVAGSVAHQESVSLTYIDEAACK